ncbi:calcium-responsive transcription factor [Protopterus annectens]|uniref:calcium-responsive transcription factor n=1 Tax=Protopterus annectens TaxID=7888 RepID=UPI001CFBEE48|nr:calcium-responsive transcription factor [Protopterus annectens]XP_043931027.1 calcium-responsive transcription factor [Protopterus annectens]
MDENGDENEVELQKAGKLVGVESNITEDSETDQRVFQQLSCLDAGAPAFGQNDPSEILPITVHIADNSVVPQNATLPMPQMQPLPDHLQLVDQNGQPFQYNLQSLGDANTPMMIVASQSENGQLLHVIPSSQPGMAQVIIPQSQLLGVTGLQSSSENKQIAEGLPTVSVAELADSASTYIINSQSPSDTCKKTTVRVTEDSYSTILQPLPSNIPAWARRLRNCEKIGDSYRGYCSSEAELTCVLTMHKQQTQSVWGTRQSPSPAKPATRLMWKSQYVPYDGIPFVNAGSRAIVMECQFGPRRNGVQRKKTLEQENNTNQLYKATCPARIYIKKVRKFPEYRVPTDPQIDKKIIRQEQEKAFNTLKKNLIEAGGVLRWYVQLPTQQAHQYHDLDVTYLYFPPASLSVPEEEEEEEESRLVNESSPASSRLHPRVSDKIRELVSQGIHQVYAVRKQLRKFVERELFKPDEVPERHNLSFFPTVNDIKNHIHEIQRSLNGDAVSYDSEAIPATLQWTSDSGNVLTESLTVTLASAPEEGGSTSDSVITKVEPSQSEETLMPDTSQLVSSLSSLQPKIFAQLQEIQLQPAFTSSEGTLTTLVTVNTHQLPNSCDSGMIDANTGVAIANQPLVLSQGHVLQPNTALSVGDSATSSMINLSVPDQNLVSMAQLVAMGGEDKIGEEASQILLREGQTIPIQIVDDHSTLVQENPEETVCLSQVKQESSEGLPQTVPLQLNEAAHYEGSYTVTTIN